MQNYVKDGNTVAITAGSALSAGDAVVLADSGSAMLVTALNDIANGALGEARATGVVTLPKVSAAVIAQGGMVSWDASAAAVDDDQATQQTGNDFFCGTAMEAAGAGVLTIDVKLFGHATALA